MNRMRPIKSYVRRAGRMTPGQKRALSKLWPDFGIERTGRELDLDTLYGRHSERVLEIGFGDGESLVEQAAEHPEMDFIGVEVHEPGVGRCLLQADAAGLSNLRVIMHDAIEVLEEGIADGALSRINLYFPDPWPKKRHHKRRILNPAFMALAAAKLAPGGTLHVATDWAGYAEHIDALIDETPGFRLGERREHGGDAALERPMTKFEKRGLDHGHRIWDWRLVRI